MNHIIFALLFSFTACFAFAQSTDVAHETVNAQGVEQVKFDLGTKDVIIKTTKGSRIIVESRVTISLSNETLLKYLIDSGRYGVESAIDASTGVMTIARKRTKNVLIVKGQECEEKFSFTIFLPEGIKFSESSSASNN